MRNSNARKDATLGMPHGTAANRLRKMVIFDLLKRHGENICFKCSESIVEVNDLSIEHKQPWEGISATLFWDLANVAFSHLRCNRPDRPSGGGWNKVTVPEGTIWCGACDSPKPVSEFTSGSKNQCRSCKSILNARRERNAVVV